jgi:hypothetical protein
MPSYNKHIEQTAHNGELLRFIGDQNKQTYFSDWYVTIVFYTALHCFEAMLFRVKPVVQFGTLNVRIEHSGSLSTLYPKNSEHQIRKRLLKDSFPQISVPYLTLYEMSRAARYECHATNTHNWVDAEMYLQDVKTLCDAES